MPNTYLSKTYSGNGNRNKGTISVWCKFSDAGASADSTIFGAGNTGNDSDCTFLSVNGNGFGNVSTRQIIFALRISGGTVYKAVSNNLLRDVNGWYHIVVRWDTTLGTPNCDIYLNGEEVSYSSNNWSSVSQNTNTYIGGTAQPHYIGRGATNAMQNNYMDGYLSHMHYCDGYYYDASTFGSTDATTGEWKINTSPSVTYGTNGFFLFKDNASTTDQSGQGNNWSVTAGTLTKTEDNPSNNFATINPLQSFNSGGLDIDFANTRVRGNGSAWMRANAGLAAKSGKWYYEAYIQHTTSGRPIRLGWDSADNPNNGSDTYYSGFSISTDGYIRGGVNGYSGYDPNATALGVTFTTGDYIGLAIDIDGDTVTAYKNGTVISNVNALSLSGFTNCSIKKSRGHWITPSVVFYSVSNNDNRTEFNFGNGAFANTQLTGTTYTDSAGFGVFKYQPPTNYLAWCTKNLNQ